MKEKKSFQIVVVAALIFAIVAIIIGIVSLVNENDDAEISKDTITNAQIQNLMKKLLLDHRFVSQREFKRVLSEINSQLQTKASNIDSSTFLTKSEAEALYATLNALDTKLDISSAASKYATLEALNSSNETISDLSAQVTDIANELEDKLGISSAEALYATLSAMSDKLNITDAENKYATITDMISKLDISSAEAQYATLTALSDKLDISSAASKYATLEALNSSNADISALSAQVTDIANELVDKLGISDAEALYATLSAMSDKLSIASAEDKYATITALNDIDAVSASDLDNYTTLTMWEGLFNGTATDLYVGNIRGTDADFSGSLTASNSVTTTRMNITDGMCLDTIGNDCISKEQLKVLNASQSIHI